MRSGLLLALEKRRNTGGAIGGEGWPWSTSLSVLKSRYQSQEAPTSLLQKERGGEEKEQQEDPALPVGSALRRAGPRAEAADFPTTEPEWNPDSRFGGVEENVAMPAVGHKSTTEALPGACREQRRLQSLRQVPARRSTPGPAPLFRLHCSPISPCCPWRAGHCR